MNKHFYKETILPALGLFTSVGTLLCCALPALLVTLGMGAVLAGFISAVPWITAVSAHKAIIFAVTGGVLALSAFLQWRGRYAPCPIDPQQAKVCMRLRRIGLITLLISVAVYMVGFFFAFLAADIFYS